MRETEISKKMATITTGKKKAVLHVTDLLKKEIARDKKCEEDFGDLGHLRQATFSADYFSDFLLTCDAIV